MDLERPHGRSVFVVIVNYRTAALLLDCLASLVGEIDALRGGKVIVVDNASDDGSLELLSNAVPQHGWQEWVEIVALPCNGGFAYGNNRAIERVMEIDPGVGVVVCLNPDTVVFPGSIKALDLHLEQYARVGIVGASIENLQGALQCSTHPFHSPWTELDAGARLGVLHRLLERARRRKRDPDSENDCDWVSGACLAIRAEVLSSAGVFDEGYFLYFEETDLCWRARMKGWSCQLVPNARIRHIEGAATGIAEPARRRPSYWFASRRRFLVKAHGIVGLVLADVLWAIGRATLLFRRALRLGGSDRSVAEPERFALDLLYGDLTALARGELRGLRMQSAVGER